MSATVLLIDDDKDLGQMLQDALSHSGFKTLFVQDGPAGLEVLQDQPVDLVLLDLMLPGVDGWEICRRVREFSDVPIMIVTGNATEKLIEEAGVLGACKVMYKPVQLEEFVNSLATTLVDRENKHA